MKRARWVYLLFVAAVMLVMTACSSSTTAPQQQSADTSGGQGAEQAGEVITLKVADSVPPTNYISTEGISYWMKRVEELTNNQVKFEYYPGEQLGKASSLLDLTKSKTVDIGYISYAMDKMPLSRVAELPSAFATSKEGSMAYWKLVNDVLLESEFLANGVRPVWAATLPQYQVVTTSKKIESLDDFKGLKIRSTGGALDLTLNALGATPVSIPAPETYTALERGTVDGALYPITSYEPYQLHQIAKYSTSNAMMGSFVVVYAINEEVFQSLPENVKQAMIQAGEETVEHFSSFLDQEVQTLIEKFRNEGMEMYELSDELLAEMEEKLQPVWDDWASKNASAAVPGQEVLNRFLEYRGAQ